MKKIMKINGMSCEHCSGRVEKALNEMEGVVAKVELKKSRAVIQLEKEIEDQVLRDTVNELGYEVVSIEEKKGLFS